MKEVQSTTQSIFTNFKKRKYKSNKEFAIINKKNMQIEMVNLIEIALNENLKDFIMMANVDLNDHNKGGFGIYCDMTKYREFLNTYLKYFVEIEDYGMCTRIKNLLEKNQPQ